MGRGVAVAAPRRAGGRHLLGALHIEVIFVGMLMGAHVPRESEEEVRELLRQHNCVPVFLPPLNDKDGGAPYHGFATQVLWPLLHNQIPDRHAAARRRQPSRAALWRAIRANEVYAAEVRRTLRAGDMVWIHNYHLLLVPSMIREPRPTVEHRPPPNCTISLFIHTPYSVARDLAGDAFRNQLLQGMLAANVVGFHLFEYARHFMTFCRRLLGLGENGRGTRGRRVSRSHWRTAKSLSRSARRHRHRRGAAPPPALDVEQKVSQLRERCALPPTRTVIGGLEMLNACRAHTSSCSAYEELLHSYPMWRSRLVMVQVCMPDPARSDQSRAPLRRDARDRPAHPRRPRRGDVALPRGWHRDRDVDGQRPARPDAPHRCLPQLRHARRAQPRPPSSSHEAAVRRSSTPTDGIAILSEFVGCSHVLNGAMRVNPFNLEHVVEQIDLALSMSLAERAARLAKDYTFVRTNSTATWLKVAVQDACAACAPRC